MSEQIPFNQKDPILSHPVFTLENDEVFSFILQPLYHFVKPQNNYEENLNFKEWLISRIFNNIPIAEVEEKFQGLELLPKMLCGKVIDKGDVFFWCIDCEVHGNPDIVALQCSDCFEKSNHDGHRVVMVKREEDDTYTCDCGDKDMLREENFCIDHQPHSFDIKELMNNFPQDTLKRCFEILPKVFYAVVFLFEVTRVAKNKEIAELAHNLGQKLIKEVLGFCLMCYSKLNEAFLPLFGLILQEKFKGLYNNLWHDCDDFKRDKDETYGKHPHPCECTILGNLLRLGNVFERRQQEILVKILLECSKEASFKEFLVVEYAKYFSFYFSSDYTNDDNEDIINSHLTSMVPHLYAREDLRMRVLESGHFPNISKPIQNAIYNCFSVSRGVYHVVANARTGLFYFLGEEYGSTKRILKETNLVKELTELVAVFQAKLFYNGDIHVGVYPHNVDYRQINSGLIIERGLCRALESMIEIICKYPQDTKKPLIKAFLCSWYENFLVSSTIVEKEFAQKTVSFHLGMERVFSITLARCLQKNSMQGIEIFIKENIPQSEPVKLAKEILRNTLRVLGMVRYLHIVHNYSGGELWSIYYYFNNALFEADIVSVQMMLLMDNPNNLFESLVDNFFSYSLEIQNFFKSLETMNKDDYFKQRLSVVQDFLNFLIYIMNDELCLLNLTVEDSSSYGKSDNNNLRFKIVVEKALVNLLLGSYWTDFSNLKNLCKFVLKEDYEFSAILDKITIKDQKTHKIRIKDEYYPNFDPYLFYRIPSLQADVLHGFTSKMKKDQEVDLVSGKFYSDLPEYLKSIQKNFFLSSLPAFLSIFITKIQEETISLIRPVLKLILLNLQVADELFSKNDNLAKALIEKIKTYYFTVQFSEALDNISKKKGFEDCKLCITKIQGLIGRLSSGHGQEIFSPTKEKDAKQEDTQMDTKQKLAKERMQKLKEEFAKKQASFASKIAEVKDNIEEVKSGEMELDEQRTICQYCLEEIKNKIDVYGIPIYITFTNNMYDPSKKGIVVSDGPHIGVDLNPNLERWWPVISSCNHFYHKKCFETVNKNSRAPNNSARLVFTNILETYCPLCKVLCNYFICMNEEDVIISQTKDFQMNQEQSKLYGSLSKGIELLFESILERLSLNSIVQDQRPHLSLAKDIFQRAYEYFLEGFHLDSHPKDVQKLFELYRNFFKAIGVELKDSISQKEPLPKAKLSLFDIVITKLGELDSSKRNSRLKYLQEYEIESTLNEVLFNTLQETINSKEFKENIITKNQLSVLKEHLLFKVVQRLAFEKCDKPTSAKDIKGFFKENQEFLYSTIKQSVFSLQKILFALWMNKAMVFIDLTVLDNLWTILCEVEKSDLEYIDSLLKLIEPSLTLKYLLEEIYEYVENCSESHIVLLNEMLTYHNENSDNKTPRVMGLIPRMIEIPVNYSEFITIYMKMKCDVCKKYTLSNCICLICGIVMCCSYCKPNNKSLGNLNRHARSCHMGLGLFLEVQYLRLISISSPLNSICASKPIYVDKFGQSVQGVVKELRRTTVAGNMVDFKSFVLNEEFLTYVKEVIYHHNMAKEAFKMEISLNRRHQPGGI